jgi:hypothetical protein
MMLYMIRTKGRFEMGTKGFIDESFIQLLMPCTDSVFLDEPFTPSQRWKSGT